MACITTNPRRAESVFPELSEWIDRNSLTYNEFGDLVGVGRNLIGCMLRGKTMCGIRALTEICKFTHLIFVMDHSGMNFVKSSDVVFTDSEIIANNSKSIQPVLDSWLNVRGLSHAGFCSLASVDDSVFSKIYNSKCKQLTRNNIAKICMMTGLVWVIDGTNATKFGMFRLVEKPDTKAVDILEESELDEQEVKEPVTDLSESYDWYSEEDDDMNTDVEEVKEPATDLSGSYYWPEKEDDEMNTDVEEVKEPVAEEPRPDDISSLVSDSITEAVNKILTKVEAKKPVIYGLDDYQKDAARTIPNPGNFEATCDHALFGLCSEVRELHGLYQKIAQGHEFDPDHAKKELGDILWMVAEYATAWGWSLEDVAKTNIEKLQKRYPDGFDSDKSLHREEGDI